MTPYLNAQGKALYVLRRLSDGFIVNQRATSNVLDGPPNGGPDHEYLPIFTETPPDHDQNFTIRTSVEGRSEDLTQWHIKYVVTDRTKTEMKTVAKNVARNKVLEHVSAEDFQETVVRTLSLILRSIKNIQPSEEEQVFVDNIAVIDDALSENRSNLKDIETAIDEGSKPDLNAGWHPKTKP